MRKFLLGFILIFGLMGFATVAWAQADEGDDKPECCYPGSENTRCNSDCADGDLSSEKCCSKAGGTFAPTAGAHGGWDCCKGSISLLMGNRSQGCCMAVGGTPINDICCADVGTCKKGKSQNGICPEDSDS